MPYAKYLTVNRKNVIITLSSCTPSTQGPPALAALFWRGRGAPRVQSTGRHEMRDRMGGESTLQEMKNTRTSRNTYHTYHGHPIIRRLRRSSLDVNYVHRQNLHEPCALRNRVWFVRFIYRSHNTPGKKKTGNDAEAERLLIERRGHRDHLSTFTFSSMT